MNIIVTGTKGQLGHDVLKELKLNNYNNVYGIDIDELDITDEQNVKKFFLKVKPDIIIHCAAYTAVDKAEIEKELCYKVNVDGTKNLVNQAIKYNAKFIYISTDYIFDGEINRPYIVEDTPNPQSVYGKSKYLGELETKKHFKHFILRISWVFGKNGNNFVKTILKLSNEKKHIDVVSDQTGSPTYTFDLSKLIVEMINTENYGVFHVTNEGSCNWYELAKEILKISKKNIQINPIQSSEYSTKAKRPKNSLMSKKKLDTFGFKRLPHWKDALKRFLIDSEEKI